MAGKVSNFHLRGFGAVSSLNESSHLGTKLKICKNMLLRPWGGIKCIPKYERLWGLHGHTLTILSEVDFPGAKSIVKTVGGTLLSLFQNWLQNNEFVLISTTGTFPTATIGGAPHTLDAINSTYQVVNLASGETELYYWNLGVGYGPITFTSAGTGYLVITPYPLRAFNAQDGTVAFTVKRHGKNFLLFYNMTSVEPRGGPFYLGDDGTYTGTVDFLSGTSPAPEWEILALGLDPDAHWQATRFFGQLHVSNGVDTPCIVQLARTAMPGKWRPSGHNARPATPTFTLQAPSSSANVQPFYTIAGGGGAGQRTGAASLTFTASPANFRGAGGNNRVRVSITYNAGATGISSALSGSGTVPSPYVYAITTGPGAANNSTDAIVSFVNLDSKAASILTASKSAADATADTNSWAAADLAGGSGTGTSDGFGNRTVTFYARYWDEGQDRLGYEGISSDLSAAIVIDALSAYDIVVSVTKNPTAGDGRFTQIRLYMQFGEDAEAIYVLVDPDNPLDNTTSGVATKTIGSDTPFGQSMYVDQHQALPGRHLVQANTQMWRAGDPDFVERIYISKPATEDEQAPEGANVDSYELLQSTGAVGGTPVTAMYSDNYRVHVHTPGSVTLIDPADPTDQFQPPSIAGAINSSAFTPWTNSNIWYLGSDLQLYEFNGSRYGKRDAEFAAADASAHIISRVDRDEIERHPERVFMFPDVNGQMIWFFLPSLAGPLIGFAYDFLAKGIIGEFEYPKIQGLTKMEPSRPEFIFMDENASLFVWDTSDQSDATDTLPSESAFTAYATIQNPIPAAQMGYGQAQWGSSGNTWYRQAVIAELETGFIDMSNPAVRKQFISLIFTTIQNSRAIVEVTITTKCGQTITRTYGDVGALGACNSHKLSFQALDTAVKIKLRILSAEQKAWVIRDLSLQYRTGKGI